MSATDPDKPLRINILWFFPQILMPEVFKNPKTYHKRNQRPEKHYFHSWYVWQEFYCHIHHREKQCGLKHHTNTLGYHLAVSFAPGKELVANCSGWVA
jgi:hypothetical protein